MGISANKFYKSSIDEFHKYLQADKENKSENKKFSFKKYFK